LIHTKKPGTDWTANEAVMAIKERRKGWDCNILYAYDASCTRALEITSWRDATGTPNSERLPYISITGSATRGNWNLLRLVLGVTRDYVAKLKQRPNGLRRLTLLEHYCEIRKPRDVKNIHCKVEKITTPTPHHMGDSK
jgi:hypothetical protein